DGELTASSRRTIYVLPFSNAAPELRIEAVHNLSVPNNSEQLIATVSDDGLPAGSALSVSWSMVSGPPGGTATFSDPHSPSTLVTFSTSHNTLPYRLMLTASDSQYTVSGTVFIVYASNLAPLV